MPEFQGPPKPGGFGGRNKLTGDTLGGQSGPDPDIRDIPNTLGGGGPETVEFPIRPEIFRKPMGTTNPAPILAARILNRNAPRTPNQIKGNIAGANSSIGLVYGEQRVVAKPVWHKVTGSQIDLVYEVCRGEVENVDTLIIDGRSLDVSGNSGGATFQNAKIFGAGGSCRIFEGTASQDVGTDAAFLDADYTDAVPDFCMIAMRLETQSETFAARVTQFPPRVEVVVRGVSDARDPRTSPDTIAYTTNPALHLAHFLETYVDTSKTVDDTTLTDAADYADETLASGAKRIESGMWLNQPMPISDCVDLLAEAARCTVWEEEDAFYLIPDQAITSFVDIGPARIVGDSTRVQRASAADVPDDVRVIWYDATNNAEKSAEALGNVSGRISEVRAPWITSFAQAKRYAIERLNHLSNEDLTITVDVHNQGLRLRRWDGVRFTDPMVGIEDKEMRVLGIENFAPAKWRLTLSEYQAATYSDDESTDPITADTNLPDPYDPPDVTGVSATSSLSAPIDGVRTARVAVSWTDPAWFFTKYIHVRVYDTSVSPEDLVGEDRVTASKTSVTIPGLDTFTTHRTDVWIESQNGAEGDVASTTFTTPSRLPDAPFSEWTISSGTPTLSDENETASESLGQSDSFTVVSDQTFNRETAEFFCEFQATVSAQDGETTSRAGIRDQSDTSNRIMIRSPPTLSVYEIHYYDDESGTTKVIHLSRTSPAPRMGLWVKRGTCRIFIDGEFLIAVPLTKTTSDTWEAFGIGNRTASATGNKTVTVRMYPEAADWGFGVSGV